MLLTIDDVNCQVLATMKIFLLKLKTKQAAMYAWVWFFCGDPLSEYHGNQQNNSTTVNKIWFIQTKGWGFLWWTGSRLARDKSPQKNPWPFEHKLRTIRTIYKHTQGKYISSLWQRPYFVIQETRPVGYTHWSVSKNTWKLPICAHLVGLTGFGVVWLIGIMGCQMLHITIAWMKRKITSVKSRIFLN